MPNPDYSFITGTDGNPIAVLCEQLGVDLHRINQKCNLYNSDGTPVADTLDMQVEKDFNKLLDLTKEVILHYEVFN